MGYIKYVRDLWKQRSDEFSKLMKERLIEYRKQPATLRVEKPTRIDRARAVGYKAKEGFLVVRQRVMRGGRRRPDIKGGRKTSNSGQRKYVRKNYQLIAEEKANSKYVNCEVLGSYHLGSDGRFSWYEVVFADRESPSAYLTKNTAWVHDTQGKVYRGLTSAARKSRGLRKKGIGSEKTRPSKKANRN